MAVHPNSLKNLLPFDGADDTRRHNGRPKGRINLATVVRELENEEFDWSRLPVQNQELVAQIGSPWRAIVYKAVIDAMKGNVRAAEWLRKSGYGDKMVHEFENGFFSKDRLRVEVVEKKDSDEHTTEPEADTGTSVI